MIFFRMGYKYQLATKLTIQIEITPEEDIDTQFISLTHEGWLTIKSGYAWDGPSGPTVDTPTFMRGSLIHDALYQLMRVGKVSPGQRKYADELLRDVCIEDGMWKFRAKYVYLSVRKFGEKAASTTNVKEVLIAP